MEASNPRDTSMEPIPREKMTGMGHREHHWARLNEVEHWDMIVIGGGATGLGIALHAAASGMQTILFERGDFAQGTSSRSTKLIHGGVRYLQQGNIKLVKEALRERGLLMQNAPHLVNNMKFVIPAFSKWRKWYYTLGLKVYDRLAGRLGLGRSESLSPVEVAGLLPKVITRNLQGGTAYHDGQFDDAHLALSIANTAVYHGATLLNHCAVTELNHSDGRIVGVTIHDELSKNTRQVTAQFVINAAGPFSDSIAEMDHPLHQPVIRPSQGIHLVIDRSFFPGESAMLIPKTRDGRILFAVPWHDRVILGTTDSPLDQVHREPIPESEEIAFILEHLQTYLDPCPKAKDILSAFAGIRPLVRLSDKKTAELARDHIIRRSQSGLISVLGGKWTTYRKMASDVMKKVQRLSPHPISIADTRMLRLTDFNQPLRSACIEEMEDDSLTTFVQHEIDHSMCMTVEDFLSRRTRQLLLNARFASAIAPKIAAIMAAKLGYDKDWERNQIESFQLLASNYIPK